MIPYLNFMYLLAKMVSKKAYKKFDAYLSEQNIQRQVVILSDGHGSRFDVDVLLFLRSKLMRLYITFPDATALLQLLDKVNQRFHGGYRRAKSELFTSVITINRGSLMTILAKIWAD